MEHGQGGQRRHTKEVVNEHHPSHTLFSLNSREDFCRVLESDGSFTERIGDGEEVDKEYNGTDLRATAAAVFEKRETGGEKENAHEGESLFNS